MVKEGRILTRTGISTPPTKVVFRPPTRLPTGCWNSIATPGMSSIATNRRRIECTKLCNRSSRQEWRRDVGLRAIWRAKTTSPPSHSNCLTTCGRACTFDASAVRRDRKTSQRRDRVPAARRESCGAAGRRLVGGVEIPVRVRMRPFLHHVVARPCVGNGVRMVNSARSSSISSRGNPPDACVVLGLVVEAEQDGCLRRRCRGRDSGDAAADEVRVSRSLDKTYRRRPARRDPALRRCLDGCEHTSFDGIISRRDQLPLLVLRQRIVDQNRRLLSMLTMLRPRRSSGRGRKQRPPR